MYCIKCGKEIDDSAAFCPSCGAPQNGQKPYTEPTHSGTEQHRPSILERYDIFCLLGFAAACLSFFFGRQFAVIGLVLCIIGLVTSGKNRKEGRALAIIGLIISVVSLAFLAYLLFRLHGFLAPFWDMCWGELGNCI